MEFTTMQTGLRVSLFSRRHIAAALAVAIVIDGLQVLLGPLGWVGFDQILDLMAMILTTALIGFHPLLLPSFLLELVPVADMLPTWTVCVAIVVALRCRQTHA